MKRYIPGHYNHACIIFTRSPVSHSLQLFLIIFSISLSSGTSLFHSFPTMIDDHCLMLSKALVCERVTVSVFKSLVCSCSHKTSSFFICLLSCLPPPHLFPQFFSRRASLAAFISLHFIFYFILLRPFQFSLLFPAYLLIFATLPPPSLPPSPSLHPFPPSHAWRCT